MKRLSKKQILMLHTQLIQQTGGSDGVRDYNLLDSALETPFQPRRRRLVPHPAGKSRKTGLWPDQKSLYDSFPSKY